MRMLPVLVWFLVSRARELVRKLCDGGGSQDSSGVSVIDTETGRENSDRVLARNVRDKRKKEQVRSSAAAHAWFQSLREPTVRI
jgi:hypothetical protein